ncbi:MAG TPA: peptidylprolyl isomerase [Cytophagales bacterium]|jgi:FKBP-type peptidyl-prolyl cis-trans isomerase 2|nr:peptidylprolyl isomerase [Cytophagales bacterium]
MSKAENGKKVKVHYTGKLTDGTVFDSSEGREPLEFVLGQGSMIKGFENAVMGLGLGDKTSATLKPGEAYGERNNDLIFNFAKEKFPEDINPEVGMKLNMQTAQGQPVPVEVKEVADDHVVLDANHPLAGKELVFDIELVAVD